MSCVKMKLESSLDEKSLYCFIDDLYCFIKSHGGDLISEKDIANFLNPIEICRISRKNQFLSSNKIMKYVVSEGSEEYKWNINNLLGKITFERFIDGGYYIIFPYFDIPEEDAPCVPRRFDEYDNVQNPSHISRAGRKNSKLEDLEKAIKYIEFEIEEIKNNMAENLDEIHNYKENGGSMK